MPAAQRRFALFCPLGPVFVLAVALSGTVSAALAAAQTASASAAVSQNKAATQTTLQRLLQSRQQHPALQAAAAEIAALRARLPAASALPDPMLSTSIAHVGVNRWTLGIEPMSNIGLMLEQAYPHPIKLQLREQQAYRQLLAAENRRQVLDRQLRQQVIVAYLALVRNHQSLRLNAELQQQLKQLESLTAAYVSLGQLPQEALWQLKQEQSQLQNQALALQGEQAESTHQLYEITQLSLPGDQPLVFPTRNNLPAALQPLQAGLTQHPQRLQQAQQRVLAELDLAQAEAALSPDFVLAGGLSNRLVLEPMWELRFGLTLPAYSAQKQLPEIAGARHALSSRAADEENLERQLQRQLAQSWSRQQIADQQRQLYQQELLPAARQRMEASLARFASRQVPLAEVLERLRDWLQLQQEALSAESQYYEAWANLEYLSGQPIF